MFKIQTIFLPFKPTARTTKTNITRKTRIPKRFDWITDADMKEINEIDKRGRGFDYTDYLKED